jgi:hypothetical protein
LHHRREWLDARGESEAVLPASAAVVVRPDRRLVTARDQRRTAAGANWSGDERVGESGSLRGEPVDVRGRDRRFSVAGKIRRHVVNDEPEYVWTRLGGAGGEGDEETAEEEQTHRGAGDYQEPHGL